MTDEPPGVDAWVERTSAFDRVRSVGADLSAPASAADIAEEARVAENTARDHLERLVEMNVLRRRDRGGTTTYEPDPLHTRMQTLRELLDAHDRDELLALKADLQERIEAWQDEYDVATPAELRDRAAETDAAAETRAIRTAANDWELVAHRLDVVDDAIEHYETYTDGSQATA